MSRLKWLGLLLVLFASFNANALNEKQLKKAKKYLKKNQGQVTFVFGGPSINSSLLGTITAESRLIKETGMRQNAINIGDNCEYCSDVKLFFMAINGINALTYQYSGSNSSCLVGGNKIASSTGEIDEFILEQIIKSKGKENKFYIFIPAMKTNDLDNALKDGWLEKVDSRSGNYDELEVQNCTGEKIKLFRKPPCEDPTTFKLMWPDGATWSPGEYDRNIMNVFPPSDVALRSIFLLYVPNICAEQISFHFMEDGFNLWTFATKDFQKSKEYPDYLEIEIPIDQVNSSSNEYFLHYCESASVYTLVGEVTKEDGSSLTKTLGQYSFIKCPK